MKRFAIVVAGGSGSRMQSSVPKQFLEVAQKPILVHTLEAYIKAIEAIELVLVLPQEYLQQGRELCKKWLPAAQITLVAGGKERFHSVWNGLSAIAATSGLVAIHDAVRPLVAKRVIEESFAIAQQKGSAIAAVALKDSIRKKEAGENSKAVNRNDFVAVQTPQTFRLEEIREAYRKNGFQSHFTDDASVYEANGKSVTLIQGNYENIKVTTPEDLIIAQALLLAMKEKSGN